MNRRIAMAAGLISLATLTMSPGPILAAGQNASTSMNATYERKLRKVALGISIFDGRDLGVLSDFRASIGGRRVATWTIWSRWNEPSRSPFPMAAAKGASAQGAVPVIWWEPVASGVKAPGYEQYASHQSIINGDHDAYFRQWARDAKHYKKPVLLRLMHQANSDWYEWGWDSADAPSGNSPERFIEAWRHIYSIFRHEHAKNVKFVWTVSTQTCAGDGVEVSSNVTNCLSRPLAYPGDKYVDYVGFTWENWGDAPASGSDVGDKPWVSMYDGFQPIVAALSQYHEPIMAAAIASAPDGGNRATWIRQGYQQVYDRLPQVVAISYLDVDLRGLGHRDWSLSGDSLAAYAEIAALPQFQGRIR